MPKLSFMENVKIMKMYIQDEQCNHGLRWSTNGEQNETRKVRNG